MTDFKLTTVEDYEPLIGGQAVPRTLGKPSVIAS